MDEEEFFSGSAGRITGRRVCFSFLFSFFFVITPGTTRALLYLRWFYSFRRACFYKLFLFPFFINFRSRYIREFCSMNLLTTRPRVEPRLIIHAWSCISQPSSERKNCIMRIVAPFSLSLSHRISVSEIRKESRKILYLSLVSLRWKKSGVTRIDDADLI